MKKTLLSILLATGMTAIAQTPRLSLFEEFTGENCPPCAATNPGLNAILASPTNTPKVVAIKWQVPIPSAPSATWSLYQTYKNDINWRYLGSGGYGYQSQWTPTNTPSSGINAAPTGLFDGQHQWVFGASSDHPADVNNAVISAAQSQTAAFSVSLNSQWDATYTSQDVTVSILASANFSATGNLVFRLVMVERVVEFATPPGTNGEKEFEDVAVAAFPTLQNGTGMAPTWTVGQSQTFTLNCLLPSYIRDKGQVAFVGFIQDDGNRKVAQAARTSPAPMAVDAKAISANVPSLSCAQAFSPDVVVKNNGTAAITAMIITPYLDGVAGTPFNWTGNLASGNTTTVSLNSMTTAISGGHTFSYSISGVNTGDNNANNNSAKVSFYMASSYQSSPLVESFSVAAYPPTGWGLINADGGPGWLRHNTANGISASGGAGASKYDFYNNNDIGDADELIMPPMDLTGINSPTLAFDVAYAQYSNEDDKLDVFVSDNCGANWQNVYSKSGITLSTANAVTAAFTPNSTQWRAENVDLAGFNTSAILVKFVTTSDYGNNLYIDNVNLKQTNKVGLNGYETISLKAELFPNPASGETRLQVNSLNNEKVLITVVNAIGQQVWSADASLITGENNISINVKELPTGIYNVVVSGKNKPVVIKLNVVK